MFAQGATESSKSASSSESRVLVALPIPILLLGSECDIRFVNPAAEQLLQAGSDTLLGKKLLDVFSFGSGLAQLIGQARDRHATVREHDLSLSFPGREHTVDVTVTPIAESESAMLVVLHERGMAQRLERQLSHRNATRSLHSMAAVLAHEIKNPLAGIRGAAQLLEDVVPAGERPLTELICAETDRVRDLIDRMEAFDQPGRTSHAPVNIHEVLDRVRRAAQAGFARHVSFRERFDPSLPEVLGDRDRLVQLFLNLVRNACEAVAEGGGEVVLSTAYRQGFYMSSGGERLSLPLEIVVQDNGPGVPADLAPHIFEPFITTKPRGSGLGLALAAKIAEAHGGMIECESKPGQTVFRVLLPRANVP
jgi:two-component system nitrogen regulation sensor histidine kinase GlnL